MVKVNIQSNSKSSIGSVTEDCLCQTLQGTRKKWSPTLMEKKGTRIRAEINEIDTK